MNRLFSALTCSSIFLTAACGSPFGDSSVGASYLSTGFDPALPITSGLVFWYKAESMSALGDGGAVSSWTDLSGNGYHATQAAPAIQPTFESDAASLYNGRPVIRFTGGSVKGFVTASINLGERTYFLVTRLIGASVGAWHNFILQIAAPHIQLLADGTSFRAWNNAHLITGTAFTGRHILSLTTAANGAVELFVNGTSAGALAGTGGLPVNAVFNIGYYTIGSYGLNGDMGEVIVYNTALSAANRSAVETYLNTRYAVY